VKPFLRRRDRAQLAPAGWIAQPAGLWRGQPADIVYDPDRHDCLLVRTAMPEHLRAGFAGAGYRRVAIDDGGGQELWVRDRADAARAALTRLDHVITSPSVGCDAPGLA
jgi:hypothetical protein